MARGLQPNHLLVLLVIVLALMLWLLVDPTMRSALEALLTSATESV